MPAPSQDPAAGAAPVARLVRLRGEYFDAVLGSHRDEGLAVVAVGARWSEACRRLDAAMEHLAAAGRPPGVRFYAVDVDEEPALGDRLEVRELPTLLFWHRGQLLDVRSGRWSGGDGALAGALPEEGLSEVAAAVLRSARLGHQRIDIP